MSVAQKLAHIHQGLRQTKDTLVAVSKTVGMSEIEEAYANGVTEFGENRIADALKKQDETPPYLAPHIRWHFIGHLQTNKAKKAAGRFQLIHSVDSIRLAKELSIEAKKIDKVQQVLLQVKIVEDTNKSGFSEQELLSSFGELAELDGLEIRGLMTMTPLTDSHDVWKKCFDGTRCLRDQLQQNFGVPLPELSMGMSDDWEIAVACGATMIRLGTAIFGKE